MWDEFPGGREVPFFFKGCVLAIGTLTHLEAVLPREGLRVHILVSTHTGASQPTVCEFQCQCVGINLSAHFRVQAACRLFFAISVTVWLSVPARAAGMAGRLTSVMAGALPSVRK